MLKTTWHCVSFVGGSCIFKPNLVLERNTVLRVALAGRSQHWRIYVETILSRFSQIQVLEIFATFQMFLIKLEVALLHLITSGVLFQSILPLKEKRVCAKRRCQCLRKCENIVNSQNVIKIVN